MRQLKLSIIFLFLASPVFAQTVVAIQNRPYDLKDELTLQVGYLPLDSFIRYAAVGGVFTHYFNDFFGWEIANANLVSNISTGLQDELRTKYQADTDDKFDVMQYYATSNLVFTPFYSKNLLFNSNIVHGETSFVAGGGIAKFDSGNAGVIDAGILLKFMFGVRTSLKLDIREYIYLSGNSRTNLTITLGYAYNFGVEDKGPQTHDD